VAKRKKPAAAKGTASIRATISFPSELYGSIEDIAKQKKVSLAWVVREAVEKYVADQWPLFSALKGK
jgi:predicted transcriptional regulator